MQLGMSSELHFTVGHYLDIQKCEGTPLNRCLRRTAWITSADTTEENQRK
uniref:Uncharacterized protein n=1 Tax=Anguilla anguilla TaxID=7936 RepID=A0A0E9RUH3_ANGAN